ncbi:MAG TPA: hypothetical protein VLH60_07605, partial [Sedimentisphaerales bacterium]|nr:hypothetical protein [Sedimentisphaerales bacterium]
MLNMRRIIIVVLTLLALAGVFLVFIADGDAPRGMRKEDFAVSAPEDAGDSARTGKIGDIGIELVKRTEYVQRDDQRNIQRVFGFEELIYQTGDNWRLSKPYMRVYHENAEIAVTADYGVVQVVVVGGNPVPRDARLSGNVHFRISRNTSAGPEVSDVYLDDVVFVSDRSTFYTDGPVRFVSPRFRMEGRGVEIVYNAEMEKLLLFRVDQLDEMRFAVRRGSAFFGQTAPQPAPAAAPAPAQDTQAAGRAGVHYYECILTDNVVVEHANQVILADRITIRNVLWMTGVIAGDAEEPPAAEGPASDRQEIFDYVRVVSDGGMVIRPIDGAVGEYRVRGASGESERTQAWTPEQLADKNVFRAKSIDYDMLTGDGIAQGPLEVAFFADNLTDPAAAAGRTRAVISASGQAAYKAASNELRFVGNVVGRIVESVQDWQQTHS